MNIHDPVIQRRIIVLLLAGLLGYAYFGSTLLPICYRVQRAEIAKVSLEIADKEWKVSLAQSQAGSLEKLQAELSELEAEWLKVQQLMPREEDMPALIQNFASLAGKSGVKIDLMQPGAMVNEETLSSKSVEMRIHGSYHQVGRFLSHVANASRVIRTESLTLTSVEGTGGPRRGKPAVKEGEGTVEATFKATLYMSRGAAMTQSNREASNASG